MNTKELRERTFSCPPFKDGGTKTKEWKDALVGLGELHDWITDESNNEQYYPRAPDTIEFEFVDAVDAMNAAIRKMLVERNGEIKLWRSAFNKLMELTKEESDIDHDELLDLEILCVNHGEVEKRKLIQDWNERQHRANATS